LLLPEVSHPASTRFHPAFATLHHIAAASAGGRADRLVIIDETRNAMLRLVMAQKIDGQPPVVTDTNQVISFPPVTTPLPYDYDPFHEQPKRSGKNAVYMDGHTESLDAMLR